MYELILKYRDVFELHKYLRLEEYHPTVRWNIQTIPVTLAKRLLVMIESYTQSNAYILYSAITLVSSLTR